MVESPPITAIAGRYLLLQQVASGGMASVHLGRVIGPAGFSKVVAIKRLHPHLKREPELVSRFLDEARLAARVRHANVVATLDVVEQEGEVFLVMEYVLGESLALLLRAAGGPTPPDVAAAIMVGVLAGLHAAHEARGDAGEPLGIVHRDVSPQNVIVGADGSVRVVDFGIAKATGQAQITRDGELKGKASYMPPEQIRGKPLDRRADVYAAAVVLWELLTGRRLFSGEDPVAVMLRVCEEAPPAPSEFTPVPAGLDAAVARALSKNREARYATAHEFADAIERAVPIASSRAVARYVESVAGVQVAARAHAMELAARTPSLLPPERGSLSNENDVEAGGVETETTRRDLNRRPKRIAAVAIGSVLMLAIAAIAFQRTGAGPDADIPPATAASSIQAAVPEPSSATAPPATGAPAETIELSLDPPGQPVTSSGPPRRPSRTPPPARNCNPPWVLAADGIKQLKPECR